MPAGQEGAEVAEVGWASSHPDPVGHEGDVCGRVPASGGVVSLAPASRVAMSGAHMAAMLGAVAWGSMPTAHTPSQAIRDRDSSDRDSRAAFFIA